MDGSQTARLFRHGTRQAVDIPSAFEFPGENVTIRKEGARLIIEPAENKAPKQTLRDLLAQLAAEGPLEDHERMEPIPRAMPRPFDL